MRDAVSSFRRVVHMKEIKDYNGNNIVQDFEKLKTAGWKKDLM